MREDYLHHLFNTRMFGNSFRTTTGQILEIQKFGYLNVNAGPDFLDAQISFDDAVWAGHIEFHVKSSDWFLHGHQHDMRYDNVIAHFVFEHDKDVEVKGVKLPTVELKGLVDNDHFLKFTSLAESQKPIPCAAQVKKVDPFIIYQQKERALFNRLQRKSHLLSQTMERFGGDLEKTFYLSLARTLGGKVNGDAFAALIEKLDLKALVKCRNHDFTIPAILLGMAGLLPSESGHEYVQNLKREFEFQKHRLNLKPMRAELFRFSKMHPPGFPTIRLAQLAEILKAQIAIGDLFGKRISEQNIRDSFRLNLPEFWCTHYRFENTVPEKDVGFSNDLIDQIVINTLVPFQVAVAELNGDVSLKENVVEILTRVKSESNTILRSWRHLGIVSDNAFDSQALIEQKNEFCSKKKCLFCTVGNHLLRA